MRDLILAWRTLEMPDGGMKMWATGRSGNEYLILQKEFFGFDAYVYNGYDRIFLGKHYTQNEAANHCETYEK